MCEDAYHVADFKRLKNTKQISDVLVLCPAHSELQLTSKSGDLLSVEARQIIPQVKLYEREKFQEQLLNTISTEVLNENLERQNLTIVEQDEDFNAMKAEIILQKKFIIEMREKSELLVELLEKTKEELAAERKNIKNKSYTEALKNTDKVKEFCHVPNIIIQPKTHLEKKSIENSKKCTAKRCNITCKKY